VSISDVAAGLALGASLIIVIGAQNAFLLRQGLRREHVLPVVIVCATSDVVLYVAGAAGFGALAQGAPWLIAWVRWIGAAFLVGYGVLAARRALAAGATALRAADSGDAGSGATGGGGGVAVIQRTASRTVAIAAALTWLNPHVYLDTVFLAGSVAATHGDGRWGFVLGASIASIAWFTGLGYGARLLGRLLASPRAWRILDGAIATVMVVIGVSLVL
jgi:L-lysine exporter family protein LysE/ArgO